MRDVTALPVDPYGNSGPFGEVLWYLLSEVRTRFIRGWAQAFHLQGANHARSALATLKAAGIRQSNDFLSDLDQRELIIETSLKETWVWPRNTGPDPSVYRGRVEQLRESARKIRRQFEGITPDRCETADKIAEQIGPALEESLWPYMFLRYNTGHNDINITWLANLSLLLLPAPSRIHSDAILYPTLRPLLGQPSSVIYRSVDHWTDWGSHILDTDVVEQERLDIGHVRAFLDSHLVPIVDGSWLRQAPNRSRLSDWFYWNQAGARFCIDGAGRLTQRRDAVTAIFYWCSPLKDLLPLLSDTLHSTPPHSEGPAARSTRLNDVVSHTLSAWQDAHGPSISAALHGRLHKYYKYLHNLGETHKKLELGSISHSLKNLFSKNRPLDKNGFERRIWLERLNIDSVLGITKAHDWSTAGYAPNGFLAGRAESLTETLGQAWNLGENIDFRCVEHRQVRAIFLTITMEIMANLSVHGKLTHPTAERSSCILQLRKDGNCDWTIQSAVTQEDADRICTKLESFRKIGIGFQGRLTGLASILYFLSRISSENSEVEWHFELPNASPRQQDFVYCLSSLRKGKLSVGKQHLDSDYGWMTVKWRNLSIFA